MFTQPTLASSDASWSNYSPSCSLAQFCSECSTATWILNLSVRISIVPCRNLYLAIWHYDHSIRLVKTLSYAQLCSASFYIKPTGSCSLLLQSDCFPMHADCTCILTELDTLDCACQKQLNCAFGWCNSLRGRWTDFYLLRCLLFILG